MREGLRLRYMEWFASLLAEVEKEGKALAILGDDIIGEVYEESGELHWRPCMMEEIDVLGEEERLQYNREVLGSLMEKTPDVDCDEDDTGGALGP